MAARAFWWTGEGKGELRPAGIGDGPIRVRALFGTLSRGTERLVAQGRVPPSEWQRMACPAMEGSFAFPVKYGYCVVGRVEQGPPGWDGRAVFALHPHQDRFSVAEVGALTLIPDGVPPRRAILLANLETALNAAWDAPLMPGMRVAVVGAGMIGCLFARIARRTAGVDVTLVDRDPARQALADALDIRFAGEALGEHDLVVEATGHPEALDAALGLCATEATLLVLSWYGARSAPLGLGGAFHSRRLRLVSSQVGAIAPSMRSRVDYAERKRRAATLLDDPALDALIGPPLRFADLPTQALLRLLDQDDVRAPLIVYD
jgi:hypothetical protein